MPKKFKGENSKAAEARARIEEKKLQEKEKIKQEKEDELWRDDDKLINRKNQRKDEMERKKQEALMRKMENKKVYEDEMSQLKGKPTTQMVNKVTHFSIANKKSSELEALNNKIFTKLSNVIQPIELEENFNKSFSLDDQARNVDQALSLLNSTSDGKVSDIDQHPERRMRAAFAAFESCHLERLKKENPHLRLSQVKQMLRKEWLKSPENPMNQHIQQTNKARIMAAEINGDNNINNGDHLIPSITT